VPRWNDIGSIIQQANAAAVIAAAAPSELNAPSLQLLLLLADGYMVSRLTPYTPIV
jgi:hypothetical protein